MRSGLWQSDTWGEPTAVPSFAATLVAHAKTRLPAQPVGNTGVKSLCWGFKFYMLIAVQGAPT
jgi:hypothetical protein